MKKKKLKNKILEIYIKKGFNAVRSFLITRPDKETEKLKGFGYDAKIYNVIRKAILS